MKSVMRSSMRRGSSTNVGNVTFERSIPTLRGGVSGGPLQPARAGVVGLGAGGWGAQARQATHRSWEIREAMMEPSFSSLQSSTSSHGSAGVG